MAAKDAPKGKDRPRTNYTAEQKVEIVEKVCTLYESQYVTVKSACESLGIDDRAFRYWVAENPACSARYKKAKGVHIEVNFELLREDTLSSLHKLVRGWERKETKSEGRVHQGEIVNGKTTITKIEVGPHAAAVIFNAKHLYPEIFGEANTGEIRVTFTDEAPAPMPQEGAEEDA